MVSLTFHVIPMSFDMSEEEERQRDAREYLVKSLKRKGLIKSDIVEQAFLNVRRDDFIWEGESKLLSYTDQPLPLGDTGQTISAPHMIAIMIEEAELAPGLKVLEVGTGSGYNAALIAYIVTLGRKLTDTRIISIERNRSLVDFATGNLKRADMDKFVKVVYGDGSLGYPIGSNEMLYDRIIVTAGARSLPDILEGQLKVGGIILAPIGRMYDQVLVKERKALDKNGRYELKKENLMPVMFVSLVSKREEEKQK
jgi:protein-L-isoaspartate(D-aspartate) O-methyltransferase